MSLFKKISFILVMGSLVLLAFPIGQIWAADTFYTFSEGFSSTTHKGAGTDADWNTANARLQLPATSDLSSNSKQVNGSLTAMGNYLYYAWVDFRDGIGAGNGHIYLQRYDKTGANPLAADVKVDNASGSYIADDYFSTYIKMINDGSTYVYVFWVKDNSLYLQKFDAAGNRQWNSSDFVVNGTDSGGSAVSVTDYNGYFTGLVNSDGTLSFFWNSGSGVYMQKVDPAGAGSRVGNSVRLLGSTGNPVYVDLTVSGHDSADNYYLIYSSYNYTSIKRELFLNKYNSSGIESWTGGRVTIGSSSSINGADIATDASGNSYIVWSQADPAYITGQDVYITGINTSGSTISGWTAKKVYTDTGYYHQTNPKIRLDSANAPNVIWEDKRTTGKLDVYAQRFNIIGTAQWASSGVKINIGDNPSANALYYTGYNSNFVIDSADNSLYIAWYAYRSADFDVFGQKITTAGDNNTTDWTITQTEAGGGYVSSAVAFSDDVYYPKSTPVLSARVYSSSYSNSQTIRLYLSNNGTDYESVTSGTTHVFTTSGSSVYWKAEISTTNPFVSPIIYSLLIEYTVAGNSTPYNKILYIYDDSWHYPPTGWMAFQDRTDAMSMNSSSPDTPATGSSCVKITYDPIRASWAGFYVQASGKWRANGGTGIDISNYSAMIIKARAADGNGNAIQVQFGVGGDSGGTVDTVNPAVKTNWMTLTTDWQTFAIDLSNKNLTDINGLVMVMMRRVQNIDPVIYIDDIQFIGPGPATITDLRASVGSTPGSVNLTWTAPGGDYINTSYIVTYAQDINFSNPFTFSQTWTPAAVGTIESHTVTGLNAGQGYYFTVTTVDDHANLSGASNIYYCLSRSAGLGIQVTGEIINLGEIFAGGAKSGGPIYITNIGGVPMTASLSVANPPGWIADTTNDSPDHYILMGAFATIITNISWDAQSHAIVDSAVKSTTTKFAGDQTGVNFSLDETRKLWIRFVAPKTMSVGTGAQTIFIDLSAETVD